MFLRLLLFLTAILLASCQATELDRTISNSETPDRAKINLAFTKGCLNSMNRSAPEKLALLKMLLNQSNLSVDDYCKCITENIFSPLSPDELNEVIREGEKNATEIFEREPWPTRIDETAWKCMDQRPPST